MTEESGELKGNNRCIREMAERLGKQREIIDSKRK